MIRVNRRRAWSLALTVLACGLVILLVRQIGARVIIEQCLRLGDVLPAILALTFFKFPLGATGWRLVLPAAQRPPWWRTVRATLGSEAIGFVTLAGSVTAEPMRAAVLQQYVPLSTGIAAGAVERSIYASTGALVTALAFAIAASRSEGDSWGSALAAAIVAAVPVAVVLLARRHGSRRSAADDTGWREVLRGLWFDRRGTLHVIALLCCAQHVIMIGEAYLMLARAWRGADADDRADVRRRVEARKQPRRDRAGTPRDRGRQQRGVGWRVGNRLELRPFTRADAARARHAVEHRRADADRAGLVAQIAIAGRRDPRYKSSRSLG